MNDKLSRQNCILYICGILPVVWLALLAAPLLEGGLGTLLEGFGTALENPFHIVWCDKSLKTLLIFLMLYGLGIGIYVSNERVYRRREEQGSARWGDPGAVSKKYRQGGNENKLLTQQVALGLDGRKHRRNLNVLICGGSGAGKTRCYAKPNIMQANTSFVILDPKGELLRDTGHLLEEQGYVIKVLDLINPERSHCYNPFVYLRDDDDIQRLATNIMKNTTPKDSKSSDHFWEDMAAMLLKALISYLHYEALPEEQNFPMVMDMIRAGDVKEDNEEYVSTLDELFERLERRNPEHIAVRYYKGYHSGSGKTLKSIQITLISHLEKFNLTSLAGITQTDEMELGEIGERKTAVFAVIPDSDSSYNFIVGMLYTQLFQQLYRKADFEHGGRLPVHVHFVMDEFANVALQAIGYALLVLFFVIGVMKTCGSLTEVKRPEHALRLFVRFALAKGVITYGMDLMLALLDIVQGVISTIMQAAGFGQPQSAVLPSEIVSAIEDCGFFESIPLWAVTLIGGLFIWVLSFQMILSVYGRFFKMFMYTAIAPIPLSTFAGEPTQSIGKSFLKSYASVCLEGAVIVLACVIFSAFASSPPVVDAGAAAASMVWSYIGELIFNMLILVGSVKMADRVVREMMGL